MQRAGPFANTVLPTRETAGGLLLRLLRGERLIDLLKVALTHLCRQLIRLPARGVIAICLTFAPALGWLQSGVARCHGCTSRHAERSRRCFAGVINVSSSARVSACAGQFSTQAGPASRPRIDRTCARWLSPGLRPAASPPPASPRTGRPPCRIYSQCISPDGPERCRRTGRWRRWDNCGRRGVLAVAAGDGVTLALRFDHGDTWQKALRGQHVLLLVMRHHAGHFAGTAADALSAIAQNKVVHGFLLSSW